MESTAELAGRKEQDQSAVPRAGWLRSRTFFLVRDYGTALLYVALAFLVTLLLQRFFQHPFLFLFFAAVMASAWFRGAGAGFFAVLISTIVVDFFFLPPFHSFVINATDGAYFAAFVVCALAASWVSSSKKKDQAELQHARDQLEMRVAERTAELQKSNIELREREHQLRLLTEVIPQQIWRATGEGSIDYCNQRLLDYAGRALPEAQGERFLEIVHAEDQENFRRLWQQALSSRMPFEGEFRVRAAGGQYRSFFIRGVPLQDATGKVLRWYGTNTDIEELRNTERALEARKLVERAKGILQRDLKVGEEEAYRTMQRESQQRRKSMKEIAESIILNDDLKRRTQ